MRIIVIFLHIFMLFHLTLRLTTAPPCFINIQDMTANISHIQRLSTHDGPGIRTTVFFKGCNMRCAWCHNPESLSSDTQIGILPERCVGCGRCVGLCPEQALEYSETGGISLDNDKCGGCGICVDECYSSVFTLSGFEMSLDELLDALLKDEVYFRQSGGGVTFSGGEPLIQAGFLSRMIALLKERNISTVVQSNLSLPLTPEREECIRMADLFMVDLKIFDTDDHRRWTGTGNDRIKENLLRFDVLGGRVEIRTPVIKGVNDREEEISAIAGFAGRIKALSSYTLVPYHPLGLSKYKQFQMESEYGDKVFFNKERLEELNKAAGIAIGKTKSEGSV